MNRVKSFISIAAFSLIVLALPAIASAQYRDRDRDDDRYGNNGGYNNGGYNNGQYGNYGGDMRSTIRDLKKSAKDFQKQLDRDLDHSRYNGSRREDEMNQLAKRFKDAVNDLDNNGYYDNSGYGNNDRYGNNNRNDNQLGRVADLASQIDRSISRANVSYNSQNIWSNIRRDLQTLGAGYGGYNNNNRNNRNNGGWGNNRNNRPSWWPF